jgi:signal transduction histidine kinase
MVYSEGPRLFTEAEIQLAQAIAGQVAQAVAQKQRQVEVEKARAAAETAARARAHLLAVVSHDLKNPLGVIFAAGEHLQRSDGETGGGGGSVQRPVGLMLRAARQMDDIIHRLLDLSQSDAGRLELAPHPLGEVLRECAEVLAPLAEQRGVRLAVQPGTPLVVRCDRARVLQVLSNLVGNAIRFSPREGRVTLEWSRAGGEARVSVADEGPGIAPEHLPHIFEPYWRSGTGGRSEVGLGLAIARGYVTAHGGHIWVDTKVGQGTTFCFTLPIAEGEAP